MRQNDPTEYECLQREIIDFSFVFDVLPHMYRPSSVKRLKMFTELLTVYIYVFFQRTDAAVLVWSDQEIKISPLQPFTITEWSQLAEGLERPDVHIFQSPTVLSPLLKEILNGYYTAYTPNGYLESENITYLLGDGELDAIKIKEVISDYKSNNILFAINIPLTERYKRETNDSLAISENTIKQNIKANSGPVIYIGQNTNSKLYALLYSSKPLLLKRNYSELEDLHLGKTDNDMINYDNRLNINVIPLEGGGKVILRFNFYWLSGYWYINSVKIIDTNNNNKVYNLTTDEEIMASAHFSYHCNGYSVFSDSNGAELHIYDLQIQPDSENGKFDDANDCVPFTTAPIWSGLFISALLALGLTVALSAIMDIKTMDKFDNYKTKNLAITILE